MAAPSKCADRASTDMLVGRAPAPVAAVCPAARVMCSLAPILIPPHPAGTHSVCQQCWNDADVGCVIFEDRFLDQQIVDRNPTGVKFTYSMRTAVRAFLCKFCEAEEIQNYKEKIALGVGAPAVNNNGWADTCTCRETRIRLNARAAPGGPRYCTDCRLNAFGDVLTEANSNFIELQQTGRNANGQRATVGPLAGGPLGFLSPVGPVGPGTGLSQDRWNKGTLIACRCGRDAQSPTAQPIVTYCLCCGGTQIDVSQVKIMRHTLASIQARNAAGGLPLLNNLAANFVLSARGLRLPTLVLRNNNRK